MRVTINVLQYLLCHRSGRNETTSNVARVAVQMSQRIPKISIGTYRVRNNADSIHTIRKGLEMGYSGIDTAQGYKNEEMIPLVTKSLRVAQDVYLVSKIAPGNQGEKARESILNSLRKLNVKCLDLMLIHWPGASSFRPDSPENQKMRAKTYQELLKAKNEGLLREVGVSNYTLRHLKELEIPPYLNQIEFHPLVYDDRMKELLKYSKERNIIIQAYSPLAEGKLVNKEWEIPELYQISQKRNATVAQVLLKWTLEKGVLIVVKSSKIQRLKENLDSLNLHLPLEDIKVIDSLIDKYGYRKSCWDPETIL